MTKLLLLPLASLLALTQGSILARGPHLSEVAIGKSSTALSCALVNAGETVERCEFISPKGRVFSVFGNGVVDEDNAIVDGLRSGKDGNSCSIEIAQLEQEHLGKVYAIFRSQ